MQHRACVAGLRDRQMQRRFSARFAKAADDRSAGIHLDQLLGLDPAFVHTARRHQQQQRITLQYTAEVAARAIAPAAPIDLGHGLAEVQGQIRGLLQGGWAG